MTYTVQAGDTMYSIARKFSITVAELQQINQLQPYDTLNIGQNLKVSANASAQGEFHLVQRGESLYSIAQKYHSTPQEILQINGLAANTSIFIGQRLRIKTHQGYGNTSGSASGTYTVQRGDSLYAIANRFQTSVQDILNLNGLSKNATLYAGQQLKVPAVTNTGSTQQDLSNYYTVQRGDSLYAIAQKAGTTPQAILQLNGLAANTNIYVGQKLKVPSPGSGTSGSGGSTSGNTGNTPTPPPRPQPNVPAHLTHIQQARALIKVQELNGKAIMGSGLRGAVGRTNHMNPDDLDKVQKCLIQLGLLPGQHSESPAALQRKGGGPIMARSIPQTIAAIQQFQSKYKVDYWTQTPERIAMLGTRQYNSGIVSPNDVTYIVLRDFTQYKVAFPHPYNRGQNVVAEFRNFPISSYNQYYDGISFNGNSQPDLPLNLFTELGLDANLAEAVKYVSAHEGNFDAINSYDKAIFSFGFIQFAGNGGGLGALLGEMKKRQPRLFQEYFVKLGVDVDYTLRNGEVHQGELKVIDLKASNGRFEVKGTDAEKAIRADKVLHGVFIRAGYDLNLIQVQIARAVIGYVRPALGIKLNLPAFNLSNIPITEIINSPLGMAMAIDLTVNQWINKTRELFEKAIVQVAIANRLTSLPLLKTIDERQVVQAINSSAGGDQRIAKRSNSLLNSGLSSTKTGRIA
ncbi:LysM peptidoglycan-binding domain-containing protein [Rapidithrix thailandica]|uniref:LysM peptidoglycan-binding domain-containing protein n=1 Tax=Rapidithrix thailandica TaxID=413964 RepID=A0AAW9SE35_9BACT